MLGEGPDGLAEFDEVAEEMRTRLQGNSYFLKLDPKIQKDCFNAKKLYLKSRGELIEAIGLDRSQFLPIGFFSHRRRDRGRGLENEVEPTYITIAAELSSFFLRRAAREIVDLFPAADEAVSEEGRIAIYESDR